MSLKVGDRVPNFQLPASDGLDRVFYFEVLGGPIVLIVAQKSSSKIGKILLAMLDCSSEMQSLRVQTFCVLDSFSGMEGTASDTILFRDEKGDLINLLLTPIDGNKPSEAIYLLDENQRVFTRLKLGSVQETVSLLKAKIKLLCGRFDPPPTTLCYGAPALLMDNLLDAEFCGRLIESWRRDNREGLVNDGAINVSDERVKKNREHLVDDEQLRREIASTIGPRIGPELEKAFNYSRPLRFEAFTVLSYTQQRKDFFGPHRDNLRATQKRRFAMSLNLNDDYDGGELWFPEYGPHKFLPKAGSGVIFSCSLLHEALPVTRGQRWVLVTFMCD
ncbi:MAG: hypothetical protein CMM58_03485 [Rhodospirillaceae bacterium]|nr:hypothetical protein [Rhodospirillaceae bacterium]|tara:strand:+ start:1824 stop:2819 length:996 start_codon:yes stop_codon:yes gene_type:complete